MSDDMSGSTPPGAAAGTTLSGPVTGGAHGWAMSTTTVDLAAHGYAEEEFFLSGDAPVYRPIGELTFDGRWQVEEAGSVPFTTRILVRRPLDQSRFNGTVVLVWNNVSMGSDMANFDTPEILEGGYVAVLVSAQAVGIDGYDNSVKLGMTTWDGERYGTLHIPTDDASYGIFTAAASHVGPRRETGAADPLHDLKVERIVATGSSQSAARLHTYWNAIQPLQNTFDAFLLDTHFGWNAPLESTPGRRPADLAAVVDAFGPSSLLRDDLTTPMLVANTETEARTFFPLRRPDTEFFRYWEAAGLAHGPLPSMQEGFRKIEREWGATPPFPGGSAAPNPISTAPYRDAAIHRVQHWLTTGEPPTSTPTIDISGEPPVIHRDEQGIARGGIRMPSVAVPLEQLRGSNGAASPIQELMGSTAPFAPDDVRALYPTESAYLEKLDAAIAYAVHAGFLLQRDADRLRETAPDRYRHAVSE